MNSGWISWILQVLRNVPFWLQFYFFLQNRMEICAPWMNGNSTVTTSFLHLLHVWMPSARILHVSQIDISTICIFTIYSDFCGAWHLSPDFRKWSWLEFLPLGIGRYTNGMFHILLFVAHWPGQSGKMLEYLIAISWIFFCWGSRGRHLVKVDVWLVDCVVHIIQIQSSIFSSSQIIY